MSQSDRCVRCGAAVPADAAWGVCPQCLLRPGGLDFPLPVDGPFDPTQAASREREPRRSGGFQAPRPDELAEHFPQLEVLRLVGQGGMGAVYQARHRGLDRLVALKILPRAADDDRRFAERFQREARALARLNHPHVVAVFDSGRAGPYYFLIMEYVDGVNLRQAMQAGRIEPAQALAMVGQICEALQYAHDEHVVHRDIKPENVLLDRQGRVKVVDFGLAKLLDPDLPEPQLTGSHQVMGTPRYMAPEQIEGARAVDHRADIYSLGVVFYELLTGELPLGRFPPPSRRVQIDVRLDEVVLRSLEKLPDQRYQQAARLKSDMDTICGSRSSRFAGGAYEYRSEATLFGLPWVHVVRGRDPATGRLRVAKGVVAVGEVAVGGLAIGGLACGLLSIGGCSLGLLALGGAALGGVALGGLAVGIVAAGGLAVGIWATGGAAIGWKAIGGWAASWDARNAFTFFDASTNVERENAARPTWSWAGLAVALLALVGGACAAFILLMVRLFRRGPDEPVPMKPSSEPGPSGASSAGVAIGVVVLLAGLGLVGLFFLLLCAGAWFFAMSPVKMPAPSAPSVTPFERASPALQGSFESIESVEPSGAMAPVDLLGPEIPTGERPRRLEAEAAPGGPATGGPPN